MLAGQNFGLGAGDGGIGAEIGGEPPSDSTLE